MKLKIDIYVHVGQELFGYINVSEGIGHAEHWRYQFHANVCSSPTGGGQYEPELWVLHDVFVETLEGCFYVIKGIADYWDGITFSLDSFCLSIDGSEMLQSIKRGTSVMLTMDITAKDEDISIA